MPKTPMRHTERITLGKMYKEIKVIREEFEEEEALKAKKLHPFVAFCKKMHSMFPGFGKGAKYTEEYQNIIDFLGWDLKAEEFNAAVKAVMILGIFASIFIIGIVLVSPLAPIIIKFAQGSMIIAMVMMFMPLLFVTLGLTYFIQNFPKSEAQAESVRALTYVPENVGYMIMSMKLVPNLEKAVEFTAYHGRGKIAEDLKKIVWDVQLGIYTSLSEALDDLAYRWSRFSTEFKQALMMIRASVLEATEAKRYALLDKTMETILESIKGKMEGYARALSQPSIVLFYMGVLLPLILIIVLPIASCFTGQPFGKTENLILLYNLLIPGAVFGFGWFVISKRPPTYKAPEIPDDDPRLPGKNKMYLGRLKVDVRLVVILIAIIGFGLSYFLSVEGFPPKSILPTERGRMPTQLIPADKSVKDALAAYGYPENYFIEGGPLYQKYIAKGLSPEKAKAKLQEAEMDFFFKPENDTTPYNLIMGSMLTIAVCIAFYFYFTNVYKYKLQQEYIQMESEFKDVVYVLASRLGENKPVEDAIKHTIDFLPNTLLTQKIFTRVMDNIHILGLTLDKALFDPIYGALKYCPSKMINSSMKLLVDSVSLGVQVAARTLISLSMQVANSEKVTKMLRALISEITGMMQSMAVFIAPIVLGITTSLQKVVVTTLSKIATSPGATGFGIETLDVSSAASLGQMGQIMQTIQGFTQATQAIQLDKSVLAQMASPAEFLIIVSVYVIEIVAALIFFTCMIQEDNKTKMKITLATMLPIAIIIFLGVTFFARMMVPAFT